MGVKVSVVVPAYNSGPYVDACVNSLLGQSMRRDDYEVIFVDDGSTDGTGERLDAAADGHDHVRVVHIAATGGPGGPRNIGTDMARGDYVYFLDSDDWLGEEALERMHAMAERNGSDIVIGRLVGHGRTTSRTTFQTSRDRAEILDHHLLGAMTPHKLFRTAFLREQDIRFPEGPVRLEDHRFCVKAYFAASIISVLADYPCCHWIRRSDGANYSRNRFDPAHYYGALSEVLDTVDEHVEPGEARDRFYAHWYRAKVLTRMGGGVFLSSPDDYRREMFAAVREFILDRVPSTVERWVPPHMRPRAVLLRAGAYDDLIRLAEAERDVTVRPRVDALGWDDDTLVIDVTSECVHRDGAPVVFRRERVDGAERVLQEIPATLSTPIPAEALDVTDVLARSTLSVSLKHRDSGVEHFPPVTYGRASEADTVTLSGRTRVHPPTAAHGGSLDPGVWDVRVHMNVCGRVLGRRLGAYRLSSAEAGTVAGLTGTPARLVVPYWTAQDNLSIRVGDQPLTKVIAAAAPAARLKVAARRAWLMIPVPFVPSEPVSVRLSRTETREDEPARDIELPANFAHAAPDAPVRADGRTDEPSGLLVVTVPFGVGRRRLGRGTWSVEVRAGTEKTRLDMLVRVLGRHDMRLCPRRKEKPPSSVRDAAAHRVPPVPRTVGDPDDRRVGASVG